ncbi:leucine-rich repeats and immunoglobulin-like domains protein 2 [Acanthaster planci]|uniref:Leucine-rich repeats and immunoglobulin-like domains protein 2 n=1 Tax=Acanthaster planci TaxID=133434 RepID=A0A8B7ZHB4_ACAPL|nr:leucine-rich repeats and immunoglobulin-like domains protein 2 [Acanthaster planci]
MELPLNMNMELFAVVVVLFYIGRLLGSCQAATCHAHCDYDHVTRRADCSYRNLDCIPVNYPDSLVMDLSHNKISILEAADFNRTLTQLVELYLDFNNISDLTSLMTSTEMASLKKLSIKHNIVVHLDYSCRLDSLEDISLDNNLINSFHEFPHCQSLKRFSADSNELQRTDMFLFDCCFPSFISMRFNRITSLIIHFFLRPLSGNWTVLLDHNEISTVYMDNWDRIDLGLLSLSHNRLRNAYVQAPNELIISSNGLLGFDNGFGVYQHENKFMEKLDVRNNSFDSLIQPDWAEGLKILYADDNMLTNLSSTTLQGFVNLTELHLANNRLLFISSTALNQLTMLRSFYLDGNALTSLFGGIFCTQAELVELSITNNQLSVLHPNYFIGLDSLERLYLAGNRLLYVHSVVFRHMPGLITSDFSHNELEIFDITNCSLLSNLQYVLLDHNLINDSSYIRGPCNNLVVLDIGFNRIEVVSVDSLTARNRALSRLELEGNPLQCDCRLKGLREWLLNNPPSSLPRCQGPPKNSGRVVTDLDIHDFSCHPPKAVIDKNNLTVTVGQTATLSCTAVGVPVPIITWLDPNGTVITDKRHGRFVIIERSTLHIIPANKPDHGMYTCLVRNPLGETDRAVVNLTVMTIPPTITSFCASSAGAVLPTVFVTLVITLTVVGLVFRLRHRRNARPRPNPAFSGQQSKITVDFRKQKATHEEGGYVTKVDDGTYMTPTQRDQESTYEDTSGDVYEVTGMQMSQQNQQQITHDNDDVYEPVSVS